MILFNDYCSIKEVLAEVTGYTGDRSFKNGLSRGWYISRAKDALMDLKYNAYYGKVYHDTKMPESGILEIPKGTFGLEQVFVFSGECCTPETMAPVNYKMGYIKPGDSSGYMAQTANKMKPNARHAVSVSSELFWSQYGDSCVQFSDGCMSFTGVRLVLHTNDIKEDQDLHVPRFLKSYLVDYCEHAFYRVKNAEQPRLYRTSMADSYQRLKDSRMEALYLLKRSDNAKKRDVVMFNKNVEAR